MNNPNTKLARSEPTPRLLKLARTAGAVALSLGIAHFVAGNVNENKRINHIIEDPSNIPKKDRVQIPVFEGDTPNSIGQEIGVNGHIMDVTQEIVNQEDDNGNLQPGHVTVYKNFLNEQASDMYADNNNR